MESLIQTAQEIDADGLDLGGAIDIINSKYVAEMEDAGLPVYVWTVNSAEEAIRLNHAGVSGHHNRSPKVAENRTGLIKKVTQF